MIEENGQLEHEELAGEGRAASGCYAAVGSPDVTYVWDMPSRNTFNVPSIRAFVKAYLAKAVVSIDCFARNKRWATYTNDLNPETVAEYHMNALDFLKMLRDEGVQADLVIFDPPYSLNQLKRSYESVGLSMKKEDTWKPNRWSDERDVIKDLVKDGGVVLSFGWSTNGMNEQRGFRKERIMLVGHGAGHYDTICMAERKIVSAQGGLFDAAA